MPRGKKLLLLLSLAVFNAMLSLACGGGGGSGTAASATPSASPSPTPTPSSEFSIGDFEGTWHFAPSEKVDMDGASDFWFNVLSDGSVEEESQNLVPAPLVDGGSITLLDTATGEFSGSVDLFDPDGPTEETVSFAGTLNAARDTMSVHFTEWDIDAVIVRGEGRQKAAGGYSLVLKQEIRPGDTDMFFKGVIGITLNSDGTFAEMDDPDFAGRWSIFRDQFVFLRSEWDEDEDGTIDTSFEAYVRLLDNEAAPGDLEPDVVGSFVVFPPGGAMWGELKGVNLARHTGLFSLSMFSGVWNIVFQDDEDSPMESPLGLLQMTSDGTVPSQTIGDAQVEGAVSELNSGTGAFSLSLTVTDDEGTHYLRYAGYLSPFDDYVSMTEYQLDGGSYVESGFMRMFRYGAFSGPIVDGYWSLGTTLKTGGERMTIMNFVVLNSRLYASSGTGADPVGIAFLTADDQAAFFFETADGYRAFVFGHTDDSSEAFCDAASITLSTDDTMEFQNGYMGKYRAYSSPDNNLAHYMATYRLLDQDETITFYIDGDDNITAVAGGITFDLVWDDQPLFAFHLHNDLLGDYEGGVTMYFLPYSEGGLLEEMGFSASPSVPVWGYRDTSK